MLEQLDKLTKFVSTLTLNDSKPADSDDDFEPEIAADSGDNVQLEHEEN